jgi:hypothetical protein
MQEAATDSSGSPLKTNFNGLLTIERDDRRLGPADAQQTRSVAQIGGDRAFDDACPAAETGARAAVVLDLDARLLREFE